MSHIQEIYIGILDGNYVKAIGKGSTLAMCLKDLAEAIEDDGNGEDITDAVFYRANQIEVEIETVIREKVVAIKEKV